MDTAIPGGLWDLDAHTTAAYALSPYFVLWAVTLLGMISGGWGFLWLFYPGPLTRIARGIWPGDLIVGWLAVASAHHLIYLESWQQGFGHPLALWMLLGALALLMGLRLLPSPFRRPERLFILSVLVWGAVLVAGENHLDVVASDKVKLNNLSVQSLDDPDALRTLIFRTLALRRLEPSTLTALSGVLAAESVNSTARTRGNAADTSSREHPALAAMLSFRLQALPVLLERYEREQTRLRTYQWLQIGLLTASLLAWGFGTPLLRRD